MLCWQIAKQLLVNTGYFVTNKRGCSVVNERLFCPLEECDTVLVSRLSVPVNSPRNM